MAAFAQLGNWFPSLAPNGLRLRRSRSKQRGKIMIPIQSKAANPERDSGFRVSLRPSPGVGPGMNWSFKCDRPEGLSVRRKSMAAKTNFRGSFTALVTPFQKRLAR